MTGVEVLPLGEVVKPTRPRVKPSDFPDLPFIGMEHVEAHSMKLLGTVPAATMKSSAVHFKPGDVLYGRLRPYLNKVYRPTFEGLCSAEFIVLPENERVDGGYLQYFLNSPAFVRYASHLNTGDRPRVDFDQLASYEIPVPQLDEQRRIVAELEKQYSRLDEAVANLKRVKANLKRYKVAVLADAVEGQLVGDRTTWKAVRLGDIAISVRNGISIKPVGETGTRILRISAVRPMTLDLDDVRFLAKPHDDFDAYQLAAGDVLFTRYNGTVDLVGVCAEVPELREPTVYPDKLIRVRVPNDELLPAFLVIAASTGEARAFIESRIRTTAGQAGVSGADIKAIPLRVPPLEQQRRIVAEVDRRLSIVREVEAEVDANLKRAQALWQAVLARGFAVP